MYRMQLLRVWCLFFTASQVSADICNADIDHLLTKKYYLPGYIFWQAKTIDTLNCARSCIRIGDSCVSFNYNTKSKVCQLNYKAEQPSKYDVNFVYSVIADWPSQIDPDCYARPCGQNEVCIPGGLLGGTSCSFTCLKQVVRCPVPEGTVSYEPRTVGSIYNHTCDPRLVGGDSALCLPTGQWNKTINTTCKPLFQSACEDDDYCSPINGTCSDGTCQCLNGTVYNKKELTCVKVVRCPVPEGTVSYEPRTVGSIYNHTCDPRLVGGDSALCLPTGHWNKTINTTCNPLFQSACEDDDYCSPINGTCSDGTCQCLNGTVYNKKELTCVKALFQSACEDDDYCSPINGTCSDGTCQCLNGTVYNKKELTCVKALFQSACEDDDNCSPINGTCSDGTCQCLNGTVYNKTELTCVKDCGTNWTRFQDHCYRIFMEEKNFSNAQKMCENENSWLVVVETSEENKFLKRLIRSINDSYEFYWNSLYQVDHVDHKNEMGVKWWTKSGNLTPPFLYWEKDEPDNKDEHCTVFWSSRASKWADVFCTKEYRPVCEK